MRDHSNDAVFPTRNGTWHQVNDVQPPCGQIRASTASNGLRRTRFASFGAPSERVDVQTASQLLGHSSPAITREFYISKPAISADLRTSCTELTAAETEGGPNTRE